MGDEQVEAGRMWARAVVAGDLLVEVIGLARRVDDGGGAGVSGRHGTDRA